MMKLHLFIYKFITIFLLIQLARPYVYAKVKKGYNEAREASAVIEDIIANEQIVVPDNKDTIVEEDLPKEPPRKLVAEKTAEVKTSFEAVKEEDYSAYEEQMLAEALNDDNCNKINWRTVGTLGASLLGFIGIKRTHSIGEDIIERKEDYIMENLYGKRHGYLPFTPGFFETTAEELPSLISSVSLLLGSSSSFGDLSNFSFGNNNTGASNLSGHIDINAGLSDTSSIYAHYSNPIPLYGNDNILFGDTLNQSYNTTGQRYTIPTSSSTSGSGTYHNSLNGNNTYNRNYGRL